ncbi:MAG: tetratricopeptide repeat protein [Pseudomonadota bacterium]
MILKIQHLIAVALCALFLQACSANMLVPKPKLDSPAHHVKTGFKLIDLEKYDGAMREFNRAVELDPKFVPAHVGVALAHAFAGDYEKGLASLETAFRQAGNKEDQLAVNIGYMRLFTIGDGNIKPDWLQQIENAFQKAVEIKPESPDVYFYMGIAYKKSNRYDEALKQFVKVFEIGKEFVEEADREYTAIQRMKRAASQ